MTLPTDLPLLHSCFSIIFSSTSTLHLHLILSTLPQSYFQNFQSLKLLPQAKAETQKSQFLSPIMLPTNGLYLFTGALLAGPVIAGPLHHRPKVDHHPDPNAIIHAIQAISESTEKLGDTVVQRPMNIIKGLVLQSQCNGVAKDIGKGIKSAQNSEPLNMTSALHVLVATEALVGTVNKTMTAVIDAHEVFASLPLVPFVPFVPHMDKLVLKNLKKQSKLSKEFGDETIVKVPKSGRMDGQDRLDKIYHSFALAIEVYKNRTNVADATVLEEEDSVDEDIALPLIM